MFKKLFLLAICVLLFVPSVIAQDAPDEIDDPDGDWEDVIDQLNESGYIDEKDGDIVFEERRIRFEEDEDIFFLFDSDEISNFVMAATLQMEPVADSEDYQFCVLTFRDTTDDGFLAVGVDNFESVVLIDRIFEEDEGALIGSDEHGEDVDADIHVIIIAVDDEITVYVNGELVFEEDDLSVRDGGMGLLRSEGAACDADDVWIWQMEDTGNNNSSSDSSTRGSSSSSAVELPDEIDDFDAPSQDVIDTLVDEGVLGTGNAFLFGEDYAFIGASGSSFISLGRNRNRTDVVVAGEITFDSRSSNYEQCGLLLRVDDALDPVQDFLFIGIDSEGDLFIQNNSLNEEDTFDFVELGVDLDDEHHLIIIARGETVAVYVDGELVVENYPVYEVRGIFGIAQISDSTTSTCEGRNIWVYDTPFFEPGVCNVIATGNVNQRSSPSTSSEIAGQLVSGETLQVEAQTEPGDGFIWYELEDGSFVREDIISLVGDCSSLPEE